MVREKKFKGEKVNVLPLSNQIVDGIEYRLIPIRDFKEAGFPNSRAVYREMEIDPTKTKFRFFGPKNLYFIGIPIEDKKK